MWQFLPMDKPWGFLATCYMKTILSKKVLAWGDGLIHDYLWDQIKRRRNRFPGGEYSSKQEDNITPKLTQMPEFGLASPTRDIGHQRTPGDPPDPTSYYEDADQAPDDETAPGHHKRINPRGEPPEITHDDIALMTDDPVFTNNLFHSISQDRDKKNPRTMKMLKSLYNEQTPVRLKHRRFEVDQLA